MLSGSGRALGDGYHPWRNESPVVPILLANQPIHGRGGIQRYMARVARELVAAGEAVVVIEPAAGAALATIPGVAYVRFGGRSRLAETVAALAAYLPVALRRRRDYTLAAIWFPSGLVAALVPRPLRGPLGILAHGTEIAPERGGARRLLMRFTCARADAVFPNSSFTRDLLARAGVRQRVRVVPCGVDSLAEPVGASNGPSRSLGPTVLAVGRLIARKGFDRTIEALPAVRAAIPGARLEIVGDGPQRVELETLAETLGVASAVDFRGAVDDAALGAAYGRAACFALPCRRVGDDVEGFGIVYLEGAAAGLATVGGRGSGAEDAIVDGQTGLIVDGNDPAAIAQALIALLRDPAYAAALGARGRERARLEFGWARVASAIDRALRSGEG